MEAGVWCEKNLLKSLTLPFESATSRPMRAWIIKRWIMIFIDLEAGMPGEKRILPLMKG